MPALQEAEERKSQVQYYSGQQLSDPVLKCGKRERGIKTETNAIEYKTKL